MKCLIVDSSKSFKALLGSIVEQAGFDAELMASGADSLEALKSHSFDLVCVSMFLEDMDGLTFCSNLRAQVDIGRLPVIMVTSSEDKSALVKAISVGVTEVFPKNELEKFSHYVTQFVMQYGQSEKLQGKILYVEDDRAVSAMTSAVLEDRGLELDHYASAEQALEAYTQHDYDLVLTDVVLEGAMSGNALVRAIRNMEGAKARIPILALSGFNDVARKLELLHAGVNDYVTKPVLDEELLVRVSNHLTNKKLQDKIEAQQMRLHEMAMKDQLTGLYNRHFLMETAPSKLSEAFRHQLACSLIIIDADKFKNVNDTHGHQKGDIVLQEIAGVLSKACRREDIAARFGGEEFILFMAHCDAENAVAKAEKLRQAIERLKPAGLTITASFGVAEISLEHRCEFGDLFKLADEAVYEAKDTGRNKVVNKGRLIPE